MGSLLLLLFFLIIIFLLCFAVSLFLGFLSSLFNFSNSDKRSENPEECESRGESLYENVVSLAFFSDFRRKREGRSGRTGRKAAAAALSAFGGGLQRQRGGRKGAAALPEVQLCQKAEDRREGKGRSGPSAAFAVGRPRRQHLGRRAQVRRKQTDDNVLSCSILVLVFSF